MAYTKILVVHNRLDKSVDYAQNEEKQDYHSLKKRTRHNVLLRIPEVLAGQ